MALAVINGGLAVLAGSLYLLSRGTARRLFVVFLSLDFTVAARKPRSRWRCFGGCNDEAAGDGDGRRLLIVGAGDVGCKAVAQLQKYAAASLNIVGFVDDDGRQSRMVSNVECRCWARLDDLEAMVTGLTELKQALVALPLWAHERLLETCSALASA